MLLTIISVVSFAVFVGLAQAQDDDDNAALIERGQYLANITGCVSCHSPFEDEYMAQDLTPEQLRNLSLFPEEALDIENRLLAGGRPFDLGPAGVVLTPNLTPHEETGMGNWTDEEIEIAMRYGVDVNGNQLHPIMPYNNYRNMAQSDMQALIAYLRSIPAIENDIPDATLLGTTQAPALDLSGVPAQPPAQSDAVAHGAYLANTIMSCSDCHTPLDTATGAPILDEYFAGGQPYEGPWGIVYGANITQHQATGIGAWSDETITRAVVEGVRVDGRRLVFMPWEDYAHATDEDISTLVAYLRTVDPIEKEIPVPSLNQPVEEFVTIAQVDNPSGDEATPDTASTEAARDDEATAEETGSNDILLLGGLAVVLFAIAGIAFYFNNRNNAQKSA